MNGRHEDEWLKALCHDDQAYLEDDGFTERVMNALPDEHPSRGRDWLKWVSVTAATGVYLMTSGSLLIEAASSLGAVAREVPSFPALGLSVVAVLVLVWVPVTIAVEE